MLLSSYLHPAIPSVPDQTATPTACGGPPVLTAGTTNVNIVETMKDRLTRRATRNAKGKAPQEKQPILMPLAGRENLLATARAVTHRRTRPIIWEDNSTKEEDTQTDQPPPSTPTRETGDPGEISLQESPRPWLPPMDYIQICADNASFHECVKHRLRLQEQAVPLAQPLRPAATRRFVTCTYYGDPVSAAELHSDGVILMGQLDMPMPGSGEHAEYLRRRYELVKVRCPGRGWSQPVWFGIRMPEQKE